MIYEIKADYMTAVIAKAVAVFKKQNPSVGRMKCVCHDGSTVDIRIRDEKRRKAECVQLTEKRRVTRVSGRHV